MPLGKELVKFTYVSALPFAAPRLIMPQGAGEVLRGEVNAAADNATGTSTGKNEAIVARGVDEMNHGHYHGTGAGVTPHDTEREKANRAVQGEYPGTGTQPAGVGSTNYGPHSTNMGNKMDPRFDSDTGIDILLSCLTNS